MRAQCEACSELLRLPPGMRPVLWATRPPPVGTGVTREGRASPKDQSGRPAPSHALCTSVM